MKRADIYQRIDEERNYQDLNWNNRDGIKDSEKSVSEWLIYIEHHLDSAKNANYRLNKEESLAELRKIAALAVCAMEVHGCPKRNEANKKND
jgi:hypothetical protein